MATYISISGVLTAGSELKPSTLAKTVKLIECEDFWSQKLRLKRHVPAANSGFRS